MTMRRRAGKGGRAAWRSPLVRRHEECQTGAPSRRLIVDMEDGLHQSVFPGMTFALVLLGLAGAAAVSPISGAISKTEADHYIWGGINDGWHLVQRPDLSVIEERLAPGAAEGRHYHRAARQFFYVLDGALTMEMDGRVYRLTKGQGVEIAPGVPHQARNEEDAAVAILVVSAPKSHGDRVDAPLAASSDAVPD